MKVGETVEVNIGQAVVGQAKIVELGDGTATLVIPATRVVMSVISRLDTAPATVNGGTEHAILGVESREPETTPVVDTPPVPADAANTQVTEASGVTSVEAPSALETPVSDSVAQPADGHVADSNNLGEVQQVGTTDSSSGVAPVE